MSCLTSLKKGISSPTRLASPWTLKLSKTNKRIRGQQLRSRIFCTTEGSQRRIERARFSHETRNRRFFGKSNRRLDSRLRVEEFDTTLMVCPMDSGFSHRLS